MTASDARRRTLVLVVEDHDDTRQMLSMLLTMNGYEVAEAANGEDAVKDATRLHPDVILLDGTLPGLDGLSVARRLRQHSAGLARHIVFVSGYSGADLEEQVRAEGCESFLTKPVNLDNLLQIVQRLAARPGLRD